MPSSLLEAIQKPVRIANPRLSIKPRFFWIANGNNYSTVMLNLSYGCKELDENCYLESLIKHDFE